METTEDNKMLNKGPQIILLVRHGESASNVDKTLHHRIADHAVPLTDAGYQQAVAAGKFIADFFQATNPCGQTRLWNSPYRRTRETANGLEQNIKHLLLDRFENVSLREQQFGLFDGYEDSELAEKFPTEHANYKKCEDFGGKFYAKMPLGESRCDVAERVKGVFGTLTRDAETKDIQNVVIVSHGVTVRAFVMQWLHLTPEWFEAETNPKNCSIRMLKRDEHGKTHDYGYIFENGVAKEPSRIDHATLQKNIELNLYQGRDGILKEHKL
jgi:2,3-bisphosphoglycerate-dependent phosphoglycerate mutase